MSETKQITIQISAPTGPDDLGSVEIGHYIVDGDCVMLTNADGQALDQECSTATTRTWSPPSSCERATGPDTKVRISIAELIGRE